MPNSPDAIAEARRRLQKSALSLTDEQISNWLAQVEANTRDVRLLLPTHSEFLGSKSAAVTHQ